jgi:hypothetical protein
MPRGALLRVPGRGPGIWSALTCFLYSLITSETTPAPTVLPPSRIANLRPCRARPRRVSGGTGAARGPAGPAIRSPRSYACQFETFSGYSLDQVGRRRTPVGRAARRGGARQTFSIATGAKSSTDTDTLSPGITISMSSGRITVPVTSAVRKKNCGLYFLKKGVWRPPSSLLSTYTYNDVHIELSASQADAHAGQRKAAGIPQICLSTNQSGAH